MADDDNEIEDGNDDEGDGEDAVDVYPDDRGDDGGLDADDAVLVSSRALGHGGQVDVVEIEVGVLTDGPADQLQRALSEGLRQKSQGDSDAFGSVVC